MSGGPAAAGSVLVSPRPRRGVARIAFPVVAAAGVALNLLTLPAFTRAVINAGVREALPAWHLSVVGFDAVMIVITVVPMAVYLAVAGIVFLRARTEAMALFCAYTLVLFGCGVVGPLPFVTLSGSAVTLGTATLTRLAGLLTPLGLFMLGLFVLVFPSGRFVPGRLRWIAAAGGAALTLGSVLLFTPVRVAGLGRPAEHRLGLARRRCRRADLPASQGFHSGCSGSRPSGCCSVWPGA